MVQQTSLLAYRDLKDLGRRQAAVMNIIRDFGPISNLEIAERLETPINSVTPRTMELREKGLVEESHKDVSPITGKKVIFWREVLSGVSE